MAEERDDADKTEDPTLKKLDDALQRGDVAKSQEVNTWFVIAGATLVVIGFSGSLASDLTRTFRGLIANAHRVPIDRGGLLHMVEKLGLDVLAAIAIPILLLALAAICGNVIQHRLVWSAEQLKPRLDKISPLAGAKRLFSKYALVNFAKGVAKVTLIGALMAWVLWPERQRLDTLVATDVAGVLALTEKLSVQLLGAVVAALAVVAVLDYLFQYRQWFERQKMSLRELKEEFKHTEGDPAIKGKIRQLRQERMRKRMMAAVPKAAVVITNPTHYAVALAYERGMNAPVCVAKGVDLIALKIREVAAKHGIPIVENPPLARTLHATVEIDAEVAPEHYKAVAEVIGYVMRLRRSVAGVR
jgi:flagellar biosynthetic protein FlhB